MIKISKKKWVVALVAGSLLASGSAFAYWTISGAGSSATTTSGTVVAVVVNQTSTVTALAPGLAPQSLSGNFTNPNTGPVYVSGVTATVTGTDKVGCTAADYTIAGTATVNAEVPAGTSVGAWSGLTIQFKNIPNVNQDPCKTAVVSVGYTSN